MKFKAKRKYLHLHSISCRLLSLWIENHLVSFNSSLCSPFEGEGHDIFHFQKLKLKRSIVLTYSFLESQFSRVIMLALSSGLVIAKQCSRDLSIILTLSPLAKSSLFPVQGAYFIGSNAIPWQIALRNTLFIGRSFKEDAFSKTVFCAF